MNAQLGFVRVGQVTVSGHVSEWFKTVLSVGDHPDYVQCPLG